MDWEGEVGLGCLSVPLFGVLVGFFSFSINEAVRFGEGKTWMCAKLTQLYHPNGQYKQINHVH